MAQYLTLRRSDRRGGLQNLASTLLNVRLIALPQFPVQLPKRLTNRLVVLHEKLRIC